MNKNKKNKPNARLFSALTLAVVTPAFVIPMAEPTLANTNLDSALIQPVAAVTDFRDVPVNHWAYESIVKASRQGLVEGYNGLFRPNGEVTRAELATFLSRVFDGTERGSHTFIDVPQDHWAIDAINEGIELGFIKPNDYKNNKFGPDQAMTRDEIVKWLVNGLVSKNLEYGTILEELDSDLTLLPVTEFYKGGLKKEDIPYFGVAIGTGLITGYSDFSIRPSGKTSRSEVVAMLFRIQDILSKEPNLFSDLNELREVATTGTNILTLTNYEKARFGDDNGIWDRVMEDAANKKNMNLDEYLKMEFGEGFKYPVSGEEIGGFEDVLGKPYTLNNKRAVNTIERAIFVDTRGSQAKGVYKDMFFNADPKQKVFGERLNKNYYSVYYEYTTTPNQKTTLNSMYNGSTKGQVGDFLINSVNAEQFGITTPRTIDGWYYEKGENGIFEKITDDFFTKGKTVRYWAVQIAGSKAIDDPFSSDDKISGTTDDGIRYSYEILK
ncbi:S-layer homology domain-containing protein [Lysinibacillus sp. 2017]|uniref:S-layer homology domain-containing protein n=1 Tax=unclassified Lysinibacillus TaxID=2636778 RepID=UPI000D529E8F|nr:MULTISPECIES: S-layer homology domain-containing protein [unclassified Lysinibacillus]AWE06329.1 S-layer homology domain-containing protein [Lysinibacillus sp. 2017]TGN34994.1 S-layer homology domain-containing protein [Lysinibacillus sp. S2017]